MRSAQDEAVRQLATAAQRWRRARRSEARARAQALEHVRLAMQQGIARSVAAQLVGLHRTATARHVKLKRGGHPIHWREGEVWPPELGPLTRRQVERVRRALERAGSGLEQARVETTAARAAMRAAVDAARVAGMADRTIARSAGIARDSLKDLQMQ